MRAFATLQTASVEIALFDLDLTPEELAAHQAWLDADERHRAAAYKADRDRNRFVARRGQLRAWLAQQVGADPGRLRLAADTNGKPFLPDHPDVHFNLSQSRDRALAAISLGAPLGCDIEWRNPDLASREVAARFFAPGECAELDGLPERQWIEGFFNCWTRKEAYVKALGLGLSYPLHAFRVSVAPGEAARLIDAQPGWSLTSFEPAPGYQAALVTAAA